ncbi:amino acid adenylation domain-containing protein, partial [Pyxidicoccus sp. 3LFB2]
LGAEDAASRLRALPQAQVSFNYLGQLDASAAASTAFAFARESSGAARDAGDPRSHLLDVGGRVSDGKLHLSLTYSEHLHERATLEGLARDMLASLRALIDGRTTADARRYTPADFPLARLSQAALEHVLPTGTPVEDLYPLSPLQHGMLFESLLAPGSGVYVTQCAWTFGAGVDLAAFRLAWTTVVERHAILRTSFAWDGLEQPLQRVSPHAVLPWEELDWSELPASEQQGRFDALMAADRERGFDLGQAPLMRLTVIRLVDGAYRVLWSSHHLLLDGWSLGILFKELFTTYDAAVRGRQPSLAQAPAFRDFIAWLRQQSEERTREYWRKGLSGFSSPTPLPGALPSRQDGARARKGSQALHLSAERTRALQAFVRQRQLTANTVLQGAWALMLSHHAGEPDVLFGATVSGRGAEVPGIEHMVGMFINTLPVRIQVEPRVPVQQWLADLHARMLELRQYEHTPLALAQTWSDVPRGSRLFESLYVFENYPVDEAVRTSGGQYDIRDFTTTEQPDLPLVALVSPGARMELRLTFDEARFPPATVDRLLRHWLTALETMLERPEALLSSVSLLSEQERQQVLVEWNDTRVAYARDVCIHQLFEAQAALTPDAVALDFEGRQLTYAQLDSRANQLAHHLRSLGVGPESLVGVCLERSLEMVVALFGVLKSGAAYVPMDPAYPRERLAWMLEDTAAPVILLQEHLRDVLPPHSARVMCLDSEWDTVARQPESRPAPLAGPEALAYVIFTSGSTGRPKGAMNAHAGVVNRLLWMQQQYGLTPADTVLQKTPFSFDVSVWEFFWPLMTGARLVVARPGGHQDPAYLVRVMARERVTTVHFVPSMLRAFVEEPGLEALTGLRRVVCSGEALPADLVHKAHARLPVAEVHNLYGPTEAAVDVTFWECPRGDERRSVPIGRPVANTRIHLLDRHGQPVPPACPESSSSVACRWAVATGAGPS